MFVRIGQASDVVEGRLRVFDVDGTKVSVANANGRLFAFDDTCTHAGCSLGQGELSGTVVTCPCHGSEFDVTSGAVLNGPAELPVRSRAIWVEGEALLVEAWSRRRRAQAPIQACATLAGGRTRGSVRRWKAESLANATWGASRHQGHDDQEAEAQDEGQLPDAGATARWRRRRRWGER